MFPETEKVEQPTGHVDTDIAATLKRIGEELGLSDPTAQNCIDAIRRLQARERAVPEVIVPPLVWEKRATWFEAECSAGQYLVGETKGQACWGIVNLTDSIPTESIETGIRASEQDWAARLRSAAANPVRQMSWWDDERNSWTTSRVVRYRVIRISHGEQKGQWMVSIGDHVISRIFQSRDDGKSFCQDHWEKDQQVLYSPE